MKVYVFIDVVGPVEGSSRSDGITRSFRYEMPDGSERLLGFYEVLAAVVELCSEVEGGREKKNDQQPSRHPAIKPQQPAMVTDSIEGQQNRRKLMETVIIPIPRTPEQPAPKMTTEIFVAPSGK